MKAIVNDTTHKNQTQTDNANESQNQSQQPQQEEHATNGSPELDALVRNVDGLKKNDKLNSPLSTISDTTPLQTLSSINKGSNDIVHEIGRELYRENLLADTNRLSISLNKYELIVNGVRMPEDVYERIYKQFSYATNYEGSYNDPYEHKYPDSYNSSLAPPYENRHPGPYDAFLNEQSAEIAYELIRDNLVTDKNHFTYKLNKDGLWIDSVKQPEELHRRIVDEHFKPDDKFNLNYVSSDPGSYDYPKTYSADQNSYQNLEEHYQTDREELKRMQDEIDKKLLTDLLQDSLITDSKNVGFTLTDKDLTINGKKQSDAIFKKYKGKYMPYIKSGSIWNYSHHE